ncbi:hypothetical protein ABMB44_14880 [Levilactobacillus brevis]
MRLNFLWRAIDKIKGLKLGTTEAEHNKQEQETREEQIRAEERQKILEKTAKWRLTMTELERIAELEKRLKRKYIIQAKKITLKKLKNYTA